MAASGCCEEWPTRLAQALSRPAPVARARCHRACGLCQATFCEYSGGCRLQFCKCSSNARLRCCRPDRTRATPTNQKPTVGTLNIAAQVAAQTRVPHDWYGHGAQSGSHGGRLARLHRKGAFMCLSGLMTCCRTSTGCELVRSVRPRPTGTFS